MASSGKKMEREAEYVMLGAYSGCVKPGQPSWGKTVMERGKVWVSFSISSSCSRLGGVWGQGREEGGRGQGREEGGGGGEGGGGAQVRMS